jgi:hypothetical protein
MCNLASFSRTSLILFSEKSILNIFRNSNNKKGLISKSLNYEHFVFSSLFARCINYIAIQSAAESADTVLYVCTDHRSVLNRCASCEQNSKNPS